MLPDAALARLAHAAACRELSDSARGQVDTYADGFGSSAELVGEAQRLVRLAEEVLDLAVAATRARGVSWQQIGEQLDVTKQSAQGRFGESASRVADGILFPRRDHGDGGLGWWAYPTAATEDPDGTLRALNEWAERHREPYDPGHPTHEGRRVSAGLTPDPEDRDAGARARVGGISDLLALSQRIIDRDLPDGVTEREAKRVLLERKIEVYGQIAETGPSKLGRTDAREQADRALNDLRAWHREEVRDRVGYRDGPDDTIVLTLDGTAQRVLKRTEDPKTPGWISLQALPDGRVDPALEHVPDDLLAFKGLAPDAARPAAISAAIDELVNDLATQSVPDA